MSLIDDVRRIVKEAHTVYLRDCTPVQVDELNKQILTLRRGTRWHALSSDEQLVELWDGIRKDTELTDYVIACTSYMLLEINEQDKAKLVTASANSVGWISDASIIDEALTQRAGGVQWFEGVFNQAPWLLYLFILSTIPQL